MDERRMEEREREGGFNFEEVYFVKEENFEKGFF